MGLIRSIEPSLMEALALRLGADSRPGDGSLSAIQALFKPSIRVKAGGEIAAQGEACDHVHLVRRGWACRKRWLSGGRRQITALVLAGQVADLDRTVLDTVPVGVHAITDCEIVRVGLPSLRGLLAQDADLRRAAAWLFAVDASVAAEWQACVGRRPAPERLAHFACEMLVRTVAGPIRDGDGAPCPLTQADLADLTGLSAVHVNRTLQGLRADNLMMLADRRLTVLDWEALKQAAAFDPGYLYPQGMPTP